MTDEQRRYKLYRFLRFYIWDDIPEIAGSAVDSIAYRTENFWIDFCQSSAITLTDNILASFMSKFLSFIDLSYSSYSNNTSFSNVFAEGNEALATALGNAFGDFGITLSFSSNFLTFTFSNSATKKMYIPNTKLTTKQMVEIKYAEQAKDMITFSNIPLENISDQVMRCGKENYWTYDSTNKYLTINGSGETYGASVLYSTSANAVSPYTDSIKATTMIVSKDITKMKAHSTYLGQAGRTLNTNSSLNTFVFNHSNSDPITLETYWFFAGKSSSSSKPTFNIYTDNDTIKNYNYGSNITVNMHSLSEWSG